MGIRGLAIIASALAGALALAWTNPTAREYEVFQDRVLEQTLERLEASEEPATRGVLQQLVKSKEGVFLKALVRSQTTRRDFGLFSLFETKLFSSRLVVMGIAGRFIPLTDTEETLRELERSAITPSR